MRKNLNKLATLALSGMMVMSMAMPAFALDVPFKKVLFTDGKTLAPATDFTFDITEGAGGTQYTYSGKDANNQPVTATVTTLPGVEGAVTVKTPAEFTPDENNLGSDQVVVNNKVVGAQFESTAIFKVDEEKFKDKAVGVYEYKFKEHDSEYEGIQYATSEFKLYVFKSLDAQGKPQYNTAIERVKDGKGNTVHQKPEYISNNYGRHTPPETPDTPGENPKVPNNSTHNVIIKKKITGTARNESDTFKFKVQVIPGNTTGVTSGKKEGYHVESVGGANLGFISLKANDSAPTEFTVGKDQGIQIFGLTKNDKVVVTEGNNSYVMTVAAEEGKGSLIDNIHSDSATFTGDFTVKEDDAVVIVKNDKNQVTPTGIVMNVAPYAMMLAVAGGLGVVFMNRKKEEE